MLLFILISCFAHKTSMTGIIDFRGQDVCAVELEDGTLISVETSLCNKLREGDKIRVYMRKE